MTGITVHVLDTARGRPASGIPVVLEVLAGAKTWKALGKGLTDPHGRLNNLFPTGIRFQEGAYRLTFDTTTYFRSQSAVGFYPEISIVFIVRDPSQPYHIPLLLTPYGYTTYLGR